jgi:hypothetical protein
MSLETEFSGEEIVHIIPLGHEIDRAVKIFEKYKANRVYILATTTTFGKYTQKMTNEQQFFVDKVVEILGSYDIKIDPIAVDLFDSIEVAKYISNIIITEIAKGNLVYVNISSAGRLTSVVSTLAAMVHGAKAYYVVADDYTSTAEEKQKHGISICNNLRVQMINNLPFQLPNETEVDVLVTLYRELLQPSGVPTDMAFIEKRLGAKKTPGFEECAGQGYDHMSKEDRSKYNMRLKGILGKLEGMKYISTKKIGKRRVSAISPTGIFIVNISGKIPTKKGRLSGRNRHFNGNY